MLEFLDMRDAKLNGTIPDALTQIDSLKSLYLTRNQLTGPVPDFSDMMNLRFVYLDRNQLSGAVAPVSNLPNLEKYFIHRNKLTGVDSDDDQRAQAGVGMVPLQPVFGRNSCVI